MKTTKILMGVAAACAMAVAVMGCKNADTSKVLGDVTFGYQKNPSTGIEALATVNYTNEVTDQFSRGMLRFDNKKKGITSRIVMKNVSANSNPGLMGIVFNMSQNADGTYNFCLVGARNNGGHARAYVSYYTGIPVANFNKANFGVDDGTGTHTAIVDWQELNNITLNTTTNELAFFIEIEALKKSGDDTTGDEETIDVSPSNAYNIRFYDDTNPVNFYNGLSNKTGEQKTAVTSTKKYEYAVPFDKLGEYKKKSVIEAQMGFYANVYGGQTLTGEWQVADMKHNPNVSKSAAEDAQDNPLNIQIVY